MCDRFNILLRDDRIDFDIEKRIHPDCELERSDKGGRINGDSVERIAQRTAQLILNGMFSRKRDEITMDEVCREFGLSKQTLRRRVKNNLLSTPIRRNGKNCWPRSDIIKAHLRDII